MNWVMQFEILGEVALAMLLGGVIGFDRVVLRGLTGVENRLNQKKKA